MIVRSRMEWSGWQKCLATGLSVRRCCMSMMLYCYLYSYCYCYVVLLLACDALAYGVGAVLAHRLPYGSVRPTGYTSRSLSPAERNYAQIGREALACVFGIKRFFLPFRALLWTHHRSSATVRTIESTPTHLSPSLSTNSSLGNVVVAIQEYKIRFRKTEAHANTNALNCLSLSVVPAKSSVTPRNCPVDRIHVEDCQMLG